MKAPYKLLEDKKLMTMVKNHKNQLPNIVSMAMELLEYRLHYGPLGCESLDAESESFTKMIKS